MDYKEFKEQFVEAVKDKLEEMDLGDAKVDLQTVNKPNESYEAMTVTPAGGNVGVNMNVNRFYDAVEDGMPFEEAVNRASEMVDNGIAQMPEVDIASLKDYEQMKDKLAMEVVSSEANAELLSTVPHQNMEDMAVVYRFVLGKDDNGMASVVVTNSMLESYGVTPEQLHMDALENAPAIKPVVIQGMTELMTEMMGDDFAALGLAMDPADLVLRIYSFGAGILYTFLFVCFILALVSKQWTNFGILSGFLIGTTILTVLLAVVGSAIEVWKEKVKAFLSA